MRYSEEFLSDNKAFDNLITSGGFHGEITGTAIIQLGQLCVIDVITNKMIEGYKVHDTFPLRFETELDVKPITTLRGDTYDVMKFLEDTNIIVPLGGNKYRVMLSAMMNTLFSLSTQTGKGSLRETIHHLGDPDAFVQALNKLEWEFVTNVHDNVDIVYLDFTALDEALHMTDLMLVMNESTVFVETLELDKKSRKAGEQHLLEIATDQNEEDRHLLEMLEGYLLRISALSKALTKEAEMHQMLLENISGYPRSFIARNHEPLVKSSWSFKPELRSHPLMVKFQELIRKNNDRISETVDRYQQKIEGIKKRISKMPRCFEVLPLLRANNKKLPRQSTYEKYWDAIKEASSHGKISGLGSQLATLKNLLSNMDSLFAIKD